MMLDKELVVIYVPFSDYGKIDIYLNKYNQSNAKVVWVYEDQWLTKPNVIRSRIGAILGYSRRIHGRATKVHSITQSELDTFINKNHLNTTTKAKYRYGLFLKEELVAVASFSAGKWFKQKGDYHSYELIRFANLCNHTVVGGLSKLLKYFINEVKPQDIVTYADAEWSTGNSYERLGFRSEGQIDNQQFWVKQGEWIRYPAHRLPHHLINENLTDMGYILLSNQGSIKFRLVLHCG
jgi:hypothetical protein